MEKKSMVTIRISKDIWAIVYGTILALFLLFGFWAGWAVAKVYFRAEIQRLNDELEKDKKIEDSVVPKVSPSGISSVESWVGMASWYGEPFNGRLSASGVRYDMNQFTVAHRTLPFGTILIIKNLKTGRIVVAKVMDRGPFFEGRAIDVSRAIAEELGMIEDGIAVVRVWEIRAEREGERVMAKW